MSVGDVNPVDWALMQDLTPPRKLLLVTIAWVADDAGVTFKSQITIGARLGMEGTTAERWVRRWEKDLADNEFITRFRRRRTNGSHTTDLIVLNLPRSGPLDLSVYSGIVGEKVPGDCDPTGGVERKESTTAATGAFV